VLIAVLAVTFWVHWQGFAGWPGLINNDEGIYVEQAWAVQFQHTLAPYTYMYDHPFFGWVTIAAYTWATNAFHRDPTTVIAGREIMLLAHMVSSLFLYLLARRLKLRPLAAGVAVLLFSLTPLGLQFQRLVFLDNLAVMWAVIALWALASPKRSLRSAVIAALCFALAVLTKETILVLLPGAALLLWDRRDARNSKMRGSHFWTTIVLVVMAYPLYAIVKNELIPGPGHVSLVEAVQWQLFNRQGSGSLLDSHSGTFAAVQNWLRTDPFVLGVGALLIPAALSIKRLRAVAVCLAVQVLLLLRGGYLPFAYATAMFPFAALIIAGVGDRLWTAWQSVGPVRIRWWLYPVATGMIRLALVTTVALMAIVVLPQHWGPDIRAAMAAGPNLATREATHYVSTHLPREAMLVTDDYAWTDLKMQGWTAVPTFKLDLDPAIHIQLTHGYRTIAYLLLTSTSPAALEAEGLPTVAQAYQHSEVIASFGNGSLTLRRVMNHIPN
jgi:4-amino-4-deoxy-L-arabinose transferase-like glycosyltransferase